MTAKVSLLMQAFQLSEAHAFQLIQSAGADYEIAYDAYLEAADQVTPQVYGAPRTATSIVERLVAARAIAQRKAIQARDASLTNQSHD